MRIKITGGLLIDPAQQREGMFDILVENNKIVAIDSPGVIPNEPGDHCIDASGQWVVPGLVDLHVHLRDPGYEWKETIETGVTAAVLGGYTSICCMPNTSPVLDQQEGIEYVLEKACRAARARVLPIGAVSKGLLGKEMAPLAELARAGCVAFSDDGEPVYDAGLMRRALEWCLMNGLPISCHEEDKCLSCGGSMHESGLSMRLGLRGMPTVAEDVMVARDIELAHYTGGRIHICHISSARGVELVRRAKNDGVKITCEVTPHHLLLTEDAVSSYDANFKMSPPLRSEEIRQALWEGLMDGTIDAIASDHAPHENDRKEVEFELAAMGILGLQTSLPLLIEAVHSGTISRMRAIEALSTGPARCFDLTAGSLAINSPADITILNPTERWTFDRKLLASKSMNSPFLGRELTGRVKTVLVNGNIVVADGEVV